MKLHKCNQLEKKTENEMETVIIWELPTMGEFQHARQYAMVLGPPKGDA